MSDRLLSCPGCGCVLSNCPECGHGLVKGRSRPDHNRLFAIIDRAFHQWPEAEEFQPRDAQQLRAYLTVRAGHINVVPVPVPEGYAESQAIRDLYRLAVEGTAKACAGEAGYNTTRVSASGIEVISPRSISYDTVSQKEFGPIRDAILHIIEAALGVPADQLLRERAA